ncbi:MAG: hypothetical protein PHQ11_17280 [Paludibacter sp.]|jgi:hypothetical protein|nr:hypothetical protein [Paludibacter sp.]MDD4429727.1 hypothetical protein [Paludibacter sp.]
MKQLFKEKRGSAIITVLIVMGVLTLLGAAILQYSVNDNLQVHNDEKRMQAHYLARSGAEAVANYIMNHSDEVDELVGKETEPVELGKGTFKVKVTEQNPEGLLIESTGYVDDFERTVKLQLLPYGSHGLGDFALFCNSGLNAHNHFTVMGDGDVGTNAEDPGSIEFHNQININGKILVPNGDPNIVTGNVEIGRLASKVTFAIPDFPNFPKLVSNSPIRLNSDKLKIEEDGDYGSIKSGKNESLSLEIHVGDKDNVREVVVNELTADKDLTIELVGDGRLKLYVKSLLRAGKTCNINDGSVNALTVYMGNNSEIQFINDGVFKGTIFFKNKGNITITKMVIYGHIISAGKEELVINGHNNTTINGIIYAPNGRIKFHNHFTMNRGLIVADFLDVHCHFNLHEYAVPDDLPADIDIGIVSSKGYQKGLWSD